MAEQPLAGAGRSSRLPLALGFVLLGAAYLAWGISSRLLSFGGDNATYLLIAQDLSPLGHASPGAAGYAHQSYYPPLYPLVLAATGVSRSLPSAHAATVGMLLGAFAVLFAWCRSLGLSTFASAALTLAFAWVRGTYLMALEILSEPLYLLLTLTAIALTQSIVERRGRGPWAGAALAVGGATLTRSAGLAMGIAFVLVMAARRPRRWPWAIALAVLPTVAWMKLGGNSAYGHILADRYRGADLGTLIARLASQVAVLWGDWQSLFADRPEPLVETVVSLLTAAAAVGTVRRAWRFELDAIYLLGYLALIVIWPFPGEMARFLGVILPLVLVHAALALRDGLARWAGEPARRAAWALISGMGLAVLVPQLALTAARFHEGAGPELGELRRSPMWFDQDTGTAVKTLRFAARLEDGLARVESLVPANDCVLSVKPSLVGLLGHRRAVYAPPSTVDDAAFRSELEHLGCRYLFLIDATTQSATRLYPGERLAGELEELDVTRLDDRPDGRVVSILARWAPRASQPSDSR